VRSWPLDDHGSRRSMGRGFHAFFRQYYNLPGLLRRVDPALDCLQSVPDYPLVLASGHRDSFARIPRRTPPFNPDRLRGRAPAYLFLILVASTSLRRWNCWIRHSRRPFERNDGESAAAFLDQLRLLIEHGIWRLRCSPRASLLLFDVPVDDYDTILGRPSIAI
jgi:carotenoid phi-ring synthase / carotenoid chi-ring synthase